jgi:hypothetical protein
MPTPGPAGPGVFLLSLLLLPLYNVLKTSNQKYLCLGLCFECMDIFTGELWLPIQH